MLTNNGIFNRRNTHYWSKTNPRVNRSARHQHRFGINIWCEIFGTKIICPFIYRNSLTSERSLNFLRQNLEDALDNLPLADVHDCWLQQDGAPAHNSTAVRQYLSERFPGKFIGTHSETPWPARSPDLTPLDFFLWGYMKNEVFQECFETEEQLLRSVREAFNKISAEMLVRVLDTTVKRAYLFEVNRKSIFIY